MSNLINKAKDALSGNKTHDTTTTHTTSGHPSTGLHGTTAAHHADPTVNSHTGQHTGGTTHSTNHGPHGTIGNKLDPRVDSDADHRNNPTSGVGGYGHTQGTHGGSGLTSGGQGYGTTGATSTAGPHGNVGNKLDPRVDSDADHRNDPASHAGGYGQTQGTYGGSGLTSSGQEYGTTGATSTNAGLHRSDFANKLDPRVDSDADHRNNPASHTGGYGQTQGTHGGTGLTSSVPGHAASTTTTGHVGLTNDSGTHQYGTTDTTTGLQSNKVHDSKILNKLDPRTKTDSEGRAL